MATRVEMIIETLRCNPDRKFTARELAVEFIKKYPDEISEKQKNPKYVTEENLIAQLAAEIGGERTDLAKKRCKNITTRDTPRPRVYYWEANPEEKITEQLITKALEDEAEDLDEHLDNLYASNAINLSEHDLYPRLIEYLKKDLDLHCLRIDEKKSKNTQGNGGNHWLHPDIVALEPVGKMWNEVVKNCVKNSNQTAIRLWSFEVKKHLSKSNVRKSFFQTVSNSSWANFGYLVATGIDSNVESELQMLCGLHGIGVIILNTDSLFDSQILIPAKERDKIDWLSVDRIVNENSDFHNYIEQVSIYSQTGKIISRVWNI